MKIPAVLLAACAAAVAMPATAAPVAATDAAAIQSLVQRTWARYGTTGVPRGPRFDPPRTPAFARAVRAYQKTVPGEDENPDNIYCGCFDEYHPRLVRVTLDAVAPDIVEARTVIAVSTDGNLANIWRLVRTPQGWQLDDLWLQDGPISIQRRPIRNGRRL